MAIIDYEDLMKFNKSKLTLQEVLLKLNSFGLTWIEGYFITQQKRTLVCLNKDGYKLTLSLDRADRSIRNIFSVFNPYSMENIDTFLLNNRSDITLIENQTFKGAHSKIKVSCKHGHIFEITPANLKKYKGCSICSNRKVIDENRFKNVRSDLMKYIEDESSVYDCSEHSSKSVYVNCPDCKLDRKVMQVNILSRNGFGCRNKLCKNYNDNTEGLYRAINAENNKDEWIKSNAIIYIVEITDGLDMFYKVGLTSVSIKDRIQGFKKKFTNVKILFSYNTSKYYGTYIEKAVFANFKDSQYIPRIFFPGYRECLKLDNIEDVFYFIENFEKGGI